MPDIHQQAHDNAVAARDAAQAAQAHADNLHGAQVEVSRRDHECADLRDQIDALPADTDPQWRQRLEKAQQIAGQRLGWAVEHLEQVEGEQS